MNKYLKKIVALSLNKIRVWDRVAADRPDYFIANSKFIAKRIQRYYHRSSEVVYPPVEIDKFFISQTIGDYFLAGGRLVPYKRFDLLIETFKQTGQALKIFGDGPDLKRLQSLAEGATNIEFLGRVNDADRAKLYSEAQAFINPQEEDFGITMVEALASGRPVIAFNRGGAREIVSQEALGILFAEQTPDSLKQALDLFSQRHYDGQVIRNYSLNFSIEKFKDAIHQFIDSKYKEFRNS